MFESGDNFEQHRNKRFWLTSAIFIATYIVKNAFKTEMIEESISWADRILEALNDPRP